MQQHLTSSEEVLTGPHLIPALQLVDRAGLHASLGPKLKPASFTNWLQRAMAERGFPQPIRTGARSCSWSVAEVATWLASRPRKGQFLGRRRGART